ncbi:MAG: hypothetical protein MOB07_18670 [Acidobacteria bacterium]|nr:hypothetical protein [Acidobacteriota bacterium]
MQARPIRSQIYLPVLRFGITDEDWGFVIVAAILGYAIPFMFGMKIGNVPLEIVGWIVTTGLTILILNIIRRKSRPAWLRHVIQARLQGAVRHRRLPGNVGRAWLKQNGESE